MLKRCPTRSPECTTGLCRRSGLPMHFAVPNWSPSNPPTSWGRATGCASRSDAARPTQKVKARDRYPARLPAPQPVEAVQTWLAAAPEQTKLRQPDPCPPERRRSGLRRWEPRRPERRSPGGRQPARLPRVIQDQLDTVCASTRRSSTLGGRSDHAQRPPNSGAAYVPGNSKTLDPSLTVIGARSVISSGKSA